MAQDQDKTGHYVTIGIASDNEPDKFYEISIQKELDPRVQAEEVCAFLELRDPSCALATKELVRKHQTLHGPSPFDTNPVPACELAQAYAAEMDASKSDRVCPVESWLRSARGWAARRNNPRHNGQLLLSEDEDKDKQHLCSGDDGPLLNTNSDVAQNPTEKAQDSAPTRVHCPQSVAAKASTGLDQGRGRPGTSSAAFDSKSPYDGRMGWMADANHPIFSYPAGTFGCAAGPSESGGGACGEDGGEGGQPSSPSRPASFSSSAATTSMQPIGPLLAELADIALAPWSSGVKPEHRHDDRGDDDGKRVKEEFESSGDSDSGSGGGVGDGTITQADVNAALTTDPKVCSRLTYLIAVGGVSGVSGGSGVRGGTGKGEWRISRPCNRNPSSTLSSASQDGAVNGNNLTAPFGLQEEPWWRVRRRQAALEVLLDATRMLQLNGTPLRHNTQIVLCVGDGVPVARPRYSHVPPSSSSSSSSSASSSVAQSALASESVLWRYKTLIKRDRPTPTFGLVACAGSESIAFPVYMNRSAQDDSYGNWDAFVKEARSSAEVALEHKQQHRIPKAVWRGQTQGKSCWGGVENTSVSQQHTSTSTNPSGEVLCGRRKLRSVAANPLTRHLFDVDYDFLSFEEQTGYQAMIYVEGHSGWADRGRHLLAATQGPALLWQETMCREWYSLLLRPWLHYVPVDYHLTTLSQQTAWALCSTNAKRVGAMATHARAFADTVLTQNSAATYASLLLQRYAQAQERGEKAAAAAAAMTDTAAANKENGQAMGSQEGFIKQEEAAIDAGCAREEVRSYLVRTRPFGEYFYAT
eukprot:CAMPEP_0171936578 /NCGR_PEP_ID=MMETSP0993-20121228/33922_1 /TAXON_ID=483369 /ORGANISM="non described non described, Strain CCMP2098" /LENGTH=811 /DNA_ID=CAMNT_0012577775 /DNA_START=92 /DNA_END=2527 /DNA_ORIENTATION=+